jgi:hypothetical protein
MKSQLIRFLCGRKPASRQPFRRPQPARPRVEALEERVVLSTDPSQVGQWGNLMTWAKGYDTVLSTMLPSGQVMTFGNLPQYTALWDYRTNTFTTPATDPTHSAYCGGGTLLPDGRFFQAGGQENPGDPRPLGASAGTPHAAIYDPTTNSWTQVPDMNNRRWYPTVITLPDGRVLVDSGFEDSQDGENTLPQIYNPATNSWTNLTGAVANDPAQKKILFPNEFVAPNGLVFLGGPDAQSEWLDVNANNGTGQWTLGPSFNYGDRYRGSSVEYAPGKILFAGGGHKIGGDGVLPTKTCEIIDLNQPNPQWQYTGSMSAARANFNLTVLPHGEVLATGGTAGQGPNDIAAPDYVAEIWNPATGQWSVVPSADSPRWYHSGANLLPDGSVLASGGIGYRSGQVYYPSYLFNGPRPTISAAPGSIGYGQNFFIQTPDAASISSVAMIGLSTPTHSFNFGQRFENLSFSQTQDGLTVTAPANAFLAVPGYYMLFINNSNGTPSVAKIVQMSLNPVAPSDATVQVASLTENDVSWVDSGTNVANFVIQRSTDGVNFTTIATVKGTKTSYADTSFPVAANYYYRVQATNAYGSSAFSNTAVLISTDPNAPTNLVLSVVSDSAIALTWNDNSTTETGFEIQRSTDGVNFSTIATVGPNVTTYTDTGLVAGTDYTYQVRALTSTGSTGFSNTATAPTAADQAPAIPTSFSAVVVTPSMVTLSWNGSPGTVDNYVIQRSTDGVNFTTLATVGGGTTVYADANLSNWTSYTYAIEAVNGAGASGFSTGVTATLPTVVPAKPTNLALTTANGRDGGAAVQAPDTITLNWTESKNSFVERFAIERSTDGVNFTQITTVPGSITSYKDVELFPQTMYFYRVRAFNVVGNSNYSDVQSITTLQPLPTRPFQLLASAVSSSEIDLVWNETLYPVTGVPEGFYVQRSTDGVHFTTVATVPMVTVTSIPGKYKLNYQDTSLAANTTYYYRVKAYNATGLTGPTNPDAFATTLSS